VADRQAVITQVRGGSDAARAGLAAGDAVVEFNGQKIGDAVEFRMGRAYSHALPGARDWALRAVLAGHHGERRLLRVQRAGTLETVNLPGPDQFSGTVALVTASEIRPGVGCISVNNSLGTRGVVREFDAALERLRDTRALVIDLRNTPSGGNTPLARGILRRFVPAEMPYQKHVLVSEEKMTGIRRSWLELVSPRDGLSYRKPVVVLVGRWTGSMGEGLAIGFDATHAATVVGTGMAGLMGATYSVTLPHTGIGMNLPAERLYHVNGTPRETFRPTVMVDVGPANGGDPFITAALHALGES
jgi:C-terminal processing protease CtpA/Prc